MGKCPPGMKKGVLLLLLMTQVCWCKFAKNKERDKLIRLAQHGQNFTINYFSKTILYYRMNTVSLTVGKEYSNLLMYEYCMNTILYYRMNTVSLTVGIQ